MINDLTLITCSYNTPLVTMTMLRSWFKVHPYKTPVFVMENSTNEDTAQYLAQCKVPFQRNPGGAHEHTVDKAMDKVQTRYALLVDTDVVFRKDHYHTFHDFVQSGAVLQGNVEGDRGGRALHKRVHPWHCFMDMFQLRAHDIRFNEPGKSLSICNGAIYDVGATMYEACVSNGLTINHVNMEYDLFQHYEGMSWRTSGYTMEGSIDSLGANLHHGDRALYDLGVRVNHDYFHVGREPWQVRDVDLSMYFG